MCFLRTTFPNAPAHPSPPILFDQFLKVRFIFSLLTRPSVKLARFARKTLTPRFTNFFTDFEENRLFCSLLFFRPSTTLICGDGFESETEKSYSNFGTVVHFYMQKTIIQSRQILCDGFCCEMTTRQHELWRRCKHLSVENLGNVTCMRICYPCSRSPALQLYQNRAKIQDKQDLSEQLK